MSVPTFKPRRAYDDDDEIAENPELIYYMEADSDFFDNNRDLILYLLAPFEEKHE